MILRPLKEPVAHLIIGTPENWSRHVLLWNLAADPQNGPHTNNDGRPLGSGAIMLDAETVVRNLAHYTAAHASRFVPPGSVRIASTAAPDALPHVAFLTPQKRPVLSIPTEQESTFSVRFQGKDATASLPAGAVARYVW